MRITERQLRRIIREELIREQGRPRRSAVVESTLRRNPVTIAAIGKHYPQVLDETYVSLVLGMKPLSLNEGRVNEDHLRAILREQLIYEGFWDSAKQLLGRKKGWWDSAGQLLGQGIDKIKEKAKEPAAAVAAFGKNTKGVIAGMWVAASDGRLLQSITAATYHRLNKRVNAFLKPMYAVANFFKRAGIDLVMTVVEKIRLIISKLTEGLKAPGWKGLLTSMAAYLGVVWINQNLADKVKETIGNYTAAGGAVIATIEKAQELADALTGDIIEKVQEKVASMIQSFAVSAIEQLAGPLAWIKKVAEVLGTVDWVTSNLINLITEGESMKNLGAAA